MTGLEAANNAIDFVEGEPSGTLHADILPVPQNEPHIAAARKIAKELRNVKDAILPDFGWL